MCTYLHLKRAVKIDAKVLPHTYCKVCDTQEVHPMYLQNRDSTDTGSPKTLAAHTIEPLLYELRIQVPIVLGAGCTIICI